MNPASGTGKFFAKSAKVIRFSRHGCANRPFIHIVVTEKRRSLKAPVIEQLGTYDPLPNEHNEKLVSLNLERIMYWMGAGAHITRPVSQLLGLSGFLPIHPTTYMTSWRNREALEKSKIEQAKENKDKNVDS